MPKPNRLSHFLPLAFRNGQSISRFAKHCVRCNELVTADHMHGVAAVIQNRIVIAAKARCPACDAEFNPGCKLHRDIYFDLPATLADDLTSPDRAECGTASAPHIP